MYTGAVDSSIYFKQQAPDIMGSVERGLSLGQMIKKQRDEKEIQNAYTAGLEVGPDGKQKFNGQATMADLLKKGYGQQALELNQKLAEQERLAQDQNRQNEEYAFLKKKREIDTISNLLYDVKDQPSYDRARIMAAQQGIDVSKMPRGFDPGLVNNWKMSAFTAKDRMDHYFRERELQSRSLDRKEARDERRFQAGIKMDEKMQGLKTPYGLANTEDDAKKLKEAHESKMSFDSKVKEMIDLRKKYGTEYFNREAVARGKQLSKDLLLEYKNMQKLGVLSKSDEDIINAIIPDDPLGQDFAPGQDPILSNLEKFKADSDRDFNTRINTRTRSGIDSAASQIKNINGFDYQKVPGGWKRVK